MSKVIQCDRCKKIVDKYYRHEITSYDCDTMNPFHNDVDLCLECTAAFKNFVKELE